MIIISIKINYVDGGFLSHFMLYFKNAFCNVSQSLLILKKEEKGPQFQLCISDISSNNRSSGHNKTLTKQVSLKTNKQMKVHPILGKQMPWSYLRKVSLEGEIININFKMPLTFLNEATVLSPEQTGTSQTHWGNCCYIKGNYLHFC